jgi:hypothetical protein
MSDERLYIPIEEALNAYVEEFGGIVVEKILADPDFSNADYLFKGYEVVAELKF